MCSIHSCREECHKLQVCPGTRPMVYTCRKFLIHPASAIRVRYHSIQLQKSHCYLSLSYSAPAESRSRSRLPNKVLVTFLKLALTLRPRAPGLPGESMTWSPREDEERGGDPGPRLLYTSPETPERTTVDLIALVFACACTGLRLELREPLICASPFDKKVGGWPMED